MGIKYPGRSESIGDCLVKLIKQALALSWLGYVLSLDFGSASQLTSSPLHTDYA